MTAAAFDFRSPPPGDLERQAGGWLALACRRAAVAWARLLPFPGEFKPGPVAAVTAAGAIKQIPEEAVAFPLTTSDPADGTVLLALQRPLLLAFLAGLMGETPAELPADREPTELEASLAGYLARELFLDPMERAWPGEDALHLTAGPTGPAAGLRRGPPGDMTLLATLTASAPFGEHPVHLLLPRAGRWARPATLRTATPVYATDPDHIAALVREMPVELDVVLGTAELTMSAVARLRTGDLLVLRQKVADPLDGLVAGARKFRVWPGAIGPKAAVQIHTPAEG